MMQTVSHSRQMRDFRVAVVTNWCEVLTVVTEACQEGSLRHRVTCKHHTYVLWKRYRPHYVYARARAIERMTFEPLKGHVRASCEMYSRSPRRVFCKGLRRSVLSQTRRHSASSTSDSPLRVCIVGSGPAGFYTAHQLVKVSGQADLTSPRVHTLYMYIKK